MTQDIAAMNVCTGGCAWVAGLQLFFRFEVRGWAIFGLRPLVLGPHDRKGGPWASGWLRVVHALLSWVTICGALVGGFVAGDLLAVPPLSAGLGTLVTIGLCNTVNGLFELVTGVCPIFGVVHKRQQHWHYLPTRGRGGSASHACYNGLDSPLAGAARSAYGYLACHLPRVRRCVPARPGAGQLPWGLGDGQPRPYARHA